MQRRDSECMMLYLNSDIHLQDVVLNLAQLHFSIPVTLSGFYSSLQVPRT